jgi:spermidine synthase
MKLKPFFSTISFISAFLIFLLQPLIIKYLLPFFGSSSSTWITGSMFFQAVLLGGYLYSYSLLKSSLKIQKIIHIVTILLALLFLVSLFFVWNSVLLPPFKEINWALDIHPSIALIIILALSVGLPFLLLSTTTILLHAWYWKKTNEKPYFLYRISNIGSFIGLFSYPLFVEPFLSLHTQGTLWSILFFLLTTLLLYLVLFVVKNQVGVSTKALQKDANRQILNSNHPYRTWLFFSALPVFILLSFTNHFTQAVSPIPFLWILPLSLYLLSFVIAFQDNFSALKKFLLLGSFVAIIAIFYRVITRQGLLIFSVDIVLYIIIFFLVAILSHHILYKKRPHENDLSLFYLIIALGGFLGSFCIAILAPLLFNDFWEIELSLFLSLLLFLYYLEKTSLKPFFLSPYLWFHIMGISNIVLLIIISFAIQSKILYQTRNFYGVLTVKDQNGIRYLSNGSIVHGIQYLAEEKKDEATAYYAKNSGLGVAITIKQKGKEQLNIGTIGLGSGGTGAYCTENDTYVFYEINPDVVSVAKDYFTYLDSCKNVDIVLGDARLMLEKEENQAIYDVLSIDAFTDDAIPLHLLTREAFEIYLDKLKDNGILAVHISNRNLDLNPPIVRIANEFGLAYINVPATFSSEGGNTTSTGEWVLLSRNLDLFERVKEYRDDAKGSEGIRDYPLWTDDYSSILPLVRFK